MEYIITSDSVAMQMEVRISNKNKKDIAVWCQRLYSLMGTNCIILSFLLNLTFQPSEGHASIKYSACLVSEVG